MKIKYLAALLLAFIAWNSQADTEQVPIDRKITYINAYDNFIFINFSPSFQFNQGCLNPDGISRVAISTANDLGKNIYSAALSAAATNKLVGFGVSGCLNDRPRAYRIDIKY